NAESDISPRVDRTAPEQHREGNDQRQTRERDKKSVVVLERTEGCPGVGHVHQLEKIRDEREGPVGRDEAKNEKFRELIESIKRKGKKKKYFHRKAAVRSALAFFFCHSERSETQSKP